MPGRESESFEESRAPLLRLNPAEMLHRTSPPDGLSWHEYLVRLLQLAASIEHALMVQYLFAAYSLDPKKGKNADQQLMIARWQNLLLSVAKEEMGHMLTVQNVLCLLGAPAELGRDDHPWHSDFTPFPFKLERLTMDSLNRYTVAEMPDEMPDPATVPEKLYNWVFKTFTSYYKALPEDSGVKHVGMLYRAIIKIVEDPTRISDQAFREESYRFQACWDDWGRGHNYKTATHDVEGIAKLFQSILTQKDEPRRANVLIERVATRSQAKDALKRVSEQGEAAPTTFTGSHFQRFLSIRMGFERLKEANGPDWEPTNRIVEDPHTHSSNKKPNSAKSTISCPRSEKWADFFNLRYQMLLTYLGHYFQIASDGSEAPLRGLLVHKVFAEMYNLKAIASLLVRLPARSKEADKIVHDPSTDDCAGPPFQMSNTFAFPRHATGRWRLHRALVLSALEFSEALLNPEDGRHPAEELLYLRNLHKLDTDSKVWIEHVIAGLNTAGSLHHEN